MRKQILGERRDAHDIWYDEVVQDVLRGCRSSESHIGIHHQWQVLGMGIDISDRYHHIGWSSRPIMLRAFVVLAKWYHPQDHVEAAGNAWSVTVLVRSLDVWFHIVKKENKFPHGVLLASFV